MMSFRTRLLNIAIVFLFFIVISPSLSGQFFQDNYSKSAKDTYKSNGKLKIGYVTSQFDSSKKIFNSTLTN